MAVYQVKSTKKGKAMIMQGFNYWLWEETNCLDWGKQNKPGSLYLKTKDSVKDFLALSIMGGKH